MAKIHMGRGPSSDYDKLIEAELAKATGSQMQATNTIEAAKVKLAARKKRLMPAQLEFLEAKEKRKAAICTRRAGKTFVCRHLVAEAVLNNAWTNREKAQPVIQYIALTRIKALDLFWTPFKEICREIGLDAHWDDHSLRAQFPNGVLVRAGGAEDRDEIEKYRGDAYPLVVIDEAASFGPRVEELVMSALSAALMDYDGTIAMVGTPGQSQSGLFWEIYNGEKPNWFVKKWSYMTNIHFPAEVRTEAWVEANVGPLDSPKVQREYFGNWVSDQSSLVYHYSAEKCAWDGVLPKGHDWRYVMGIDVGFRDPTAFVVGAYARTHPALFIVHTESHPGMLPTEIYDKIGALKTTYQISRIVMDTGGSMARNNMEEWNRRGSYGIIAAEKQNKFTFQEHMNSEFFLGRIKIRPDSPVIKEWKSLVWDDSDVESAGGRHDGKPKEHSGFANHMSDAALYMFRESMHYRAKSPVPEIMPGEAGYLENQQKQAKLKAMADAGKPKRFRYERLFR